MASLGFVVEEKRCTRCGACARDCITHIIRQEGASLPAIMPGDEANCLQCQHCLAVCPTGAVSILGRNPDRSIPLGENAFPTFDQQATLIRGRRSVRQYRDENVPAAEIKRLLDAVANSPTGCNNRQLTFTVIDDRAVMARLRERTINCLAAAQKAGKDAEGPSFVWDAIAAWRERKVDVIFRGAPHALIVSAPPTAPCAMEDVTIALSYFELLAHCAGLGTVWCGMLKFVMQVAPELKALVGVPADHPFYCMMFGKPAVRYPRAIQRDDGATVRRVVL